MSEAEFLDWISHFIQISDGSLSQTGASTTSPSSSSLGAQQSARGKKLGKSKVARSSTANSSLAAQLPEMPRNRRGSGSGLALIRSLSSSAAGEQQVSATNSSSSGSSSGSKSGSASRKEERQQQDQLAVSAESEARNDLRAAFAVFDLDGDGFITIDEVRAGLKLLGESWSAQELKQVFSRCSSNSHLAAQSSDLSNQRINIDDFVKLLL